MPSDSLEKWQTVRAAEMDELENAHRSVGGIGRGRRYMTRQINHAYTVLLASQFQGYCRDLHSECSRAVVNVVQPVNVRSLLEEALTGGRKTLYRKLDSGNANWGNIVEDFERLHINLKDEIEKSSPLYARWIKSLEELNVWRNAIAHQNFTKVSASAVQLKQVRKWRTDLKEMAITMDATLYTYLSVFIGAPPW